jgi:hypothetical protein
MSRRAERRGLSFDALYSELCESERSRRLAFCFRGDVCSGSFATDRSEWLCPVRPAADVDRIVTQT